MAIRGRRNQPGGRPEFPWYTFPRVVGPKVLAQWNGKLSWMKERKVHVPAEVNWAWKDQVSLLEAIELFWFNPLMGFKGGFLYGKEEVVSKSRSDLKGIDG